MRYLITVIIAVHCLSGHAQSSFGRVFRQALLDMEDTRWEAAADKWTTLLNARDTPNLHYKLGECLLKSGRDSLAAYHLELACQKRPSRSYDQYDTREHRASPDAKLYLAMALSRLERFDEARKRYGEYTEKLPPAHIGRARSSLEMDGIRIAEAQLARPNDIKMFPVFKSDLVEFFAPCPLIDGSVMYIGILDKGEYYTAESIRQPDGSWSAPAQVVGTDIGQYPGQVSFDGTSLLTILGEELYHGRVTPEGLKTSDMNMLASRACYGRDGNLFFSKSANGQRDIYIMSVDGVVSGWVYNSQHDEVPLAVSADGELLYVSSDRPGTMGMHDIFVYDFKLGTLTNLGCPVNSVRDELYYSPAGYDVAYLCSDRSGRMVVYSCGGNPEPSVKVVRGFVTRVGSDDQRLTVRVGGAETITDYGTFLAVAGPGDTVVAEYYVDGEFAGEQRILVPADGSYQEINVDAYIVSYSPTLTTQPAAAPEWVESPGYDPDKPVSFIFSETLGKAEFVRYFTYNGLDFSSAETQFAALIGAASMMIESGYQVEFSFEASASRVPTRKYASNKDLAESRLMTAVTQVRTAMVNMGYNEGAHYVIGDAKAEVNGKTYKNDAAKARAEYERYQFIKISVSGD